MIRINLLPPEDRIKKRQFHLPEMSTVYLVAAVSVFILVIVSIMTAVAAGVLATIAIEERADTAFRLAELQRSLGECRLSSAKLDELRTLLGQSRPGTVDLSGYIRGQRVRRGLLQRIDTRTVRTGVTKRSGRPQCRPP